MTYSSPPSAAPAPPKRAVGIGFSLAQELVAGSKVSSTALGVLLSPPAR